MKTLNDWLSAYGETHKNKINRTIHLICVPAILFSVIGILWSIPYGFILQILALIFYARLGIKPFFLMFTTFSAMNAVMFLLNANTSHLLTLNLVIFILAWIGQFYGHHVEGKKPSFFQDLQFLLIGPLWVYYH